MRIPKPCQHIFLLFVTAISTAYSSYRAACPDDVTYSTNACLTNYNTLADALIRRDETFYSGVDVETIRSICEAFRVSMHCAHNIKINCPEREHAAIEEVVSDYFNIAKLCARPKLIEDYAKNQFCYTRLAASTETCFQTYESQVEDIQHLVDDGNKDALGTMCDYFHSFEACVRSHVQLNCGDPAAHLVAVLVPPSVPHSQHCRIEEILSTTTTTTMRTTKTKVSVETNDSHGYSVLFSAASVMTVSLATSLLFILLYAVM